MESFRASSIVSSGTDQAAARPNSDPMYSSVAVSSARSCVTAAPGANWSALKPQVVSILLDHFVSEAPLFVGGSAGGINVPAEGTELIVEDREEDAEIIATINELLETRVRPAVAGDGGDIAYRGFSEGVVYLTLQGACAGCPSSTATLKHGIESLLKHYVPEVTEVRAA